jgi:hypothetical protein
MDDYWFYNRDISAGYKAYSAAMESLWIENEMRAYGLIPSPTDQTPAPAQTNQSGANAQPPANEDATRLGIFGQRATREGNKALFDRLTKPVLPEANGNANKPDDLFRAMAESIYPQTPFPVPSQITEEKDFWDKVWDANPFKASLAYGATRQVAWSWHRSPSRSASPKTTPASSAPPPGRHRHRGGHPGYHHGLRPRSVPRAPKRMHRKIPWRP